MFPLQSLYILFPLVALVSCTCQHINNLHIVNTWCISFPELRDNLSRFGAQLKATLIESVKNTIESINEFARAHTTHEVAHEEEPPSPAPSFASDSSEGNKCTN